VLWYVVYVFIHYILWWSHFLVYNISYLWIAFIKLFEFHCLDSFYCAYCYFNDMFYIHFFRYLEYWMHAWMNERLIINLCSGLKKRSMRMRVLELQQIMSGRGALIFNCGWFECSQSLNPSTTATTSTLWHSNMIFIHDLCSQVTVKQFTKSIVFEKL
jgi:hypothetical protein